MFTIFPYFRRPIHLNVNCEPPHMQGLCNRFKSRGQGVLNFSKFHKNRGVSLTPCILLTEPLLYFLIEIALCNIRFSLWEVVRSNPEYFTLVDRHIFKSCMYLSMNVVWKVFYPIYSCLVSGLEYVDQGDFCEVASWKNIQICL